MSTLTHARYRVGKKTGKGLREGERREVPRLAKRQGFAIRGGVFKVENGTQSSKRALIGKLNRRDLSQSARKRTPRVFRERVVIRSASNVVQAQRGGKKTY